MGLSHRPARIHRLAGGYDNPYAEVNFPPVRDYEFGFGVHHYAKRSFPTRPLQECQVGLVQREKLLQVGIKIKWTVSPDGELEQKRNRATAAVNYKETLYR
jgi:hypothetical protein